MSHRPDPDLPCRRMPLKKVWGGEHRAVFPDIGARDWRVAPVGATFRVSRSCSPSSRGIG